MANAVSLIARNPGLGSCILNITRPIPTSLPPITQLQLRTTRKDVGIFINRKITRTRPYHIVASLDASNDPSFEDAASDFPVAGSHDHTDNRNRISKTIREFYDCVNDGKNVGRRLSELVGEDCCFDDYSFPRKFEGKEEVCSFFDKLSKAMGDNVKFQIDEICEGDGIACAIWHLEWNEEIIPFTRGCSFFRCFTEGEKVLISEARVLIESPAKPGVVVVGLLDLVRSVFDDYPSFTRWFLKSPQALLTILVNIYNIVGAPFVNPLLVFYTHVWLIICKWLRYMISFLQHIAKHLK